MTSLRLAERVLANRHLLKNLVIRDLKYRYVGSIGGFLWSFVNPLVLLASYTFVFTAVLRQKLGPNFGTESFALFLFCGILPWILFQDTVVRSCSAITDNAQLITKTIIPSEILPISVTLSNLAHHVIGMGILLLVLVLMEGIHLSVFRLVLYLPILLVLAQGVGWIVATLHVFVRDTLQAIQILMFFWFWFTPVFYAMELVPENWRRVLEWNPMALIVTGYRSALLDTAPPRMDLIAVWAALSGLVFVAGAWFFRRAKHGFADIL